MKHIQLGLLAFGLLAMLWLSGCSASTSAGTGANGSLAPQRVDIRGSINSTQYDQGQVVLEVEAFGQTPDSRYNRAFVLVLPTTQIVGLDGQAISLSELRQGQLVAILMRGGGQGNFVGMGVARKIWLEEPS